MDKKSYIVQFLKFGIVGVSNTVIGYLLNVGTILLLRDYEVSWDYIAGNTVSFILTVLWSYYWNSRFVFTQEDGQQRIWWKALLKTYASYALSGIVISNVLSWAWIGLAGISKMVAPLLNLFVTVPLNFFITKYWAFKSEKNVSQ